MTPRPVLPPAARRAVLLLALLLAAPLGAQATASPPVPGGPTSCIDAIPASALTPVPVFVVPTLSDSSERFFLSQLGNLAQDLADRGRALLGATGDSLPHGEPLVTWRGLHRSLRVTWHRDGTARWRISPDSANDDPAPPLPGTTEAAALLARSLESARKEGTAFIAWPDAGAADSLVFDLRLLSPLVDDTNGVHPLNAHVAAPMMIIQMPRMHEVSVVRMRKPSYPAGNLRGSATGTVILEFVVDTMGRADMPTLHDLWPNGRPRLDGSLGDYYAAFVRSARLAVEQATFEPERIAGCRVRQVVQQPFTYSIR